MSNNHLYTHGITGQECAMQSGSSFPHHNGEIILATPELARHWLNTYPYDGQRKISMPHVRMLASEMAQGNFLPSTTIRFIVRNNHAFLIDGQHRLHALIRSNMPQKFVLIVETAKSDDDVARQYSCLDKSKRRSYSDAYSAYKLSDKYGVSGRVLDGFGAAVDFLASGMVPTHRSVKVSFMERLRIMDLYVPYLHQYIRLMDGSPPVIRTPALRSYCIAIGILSLRFSHQEALRKNRPSVHEFWEDVFHDDGVGVDSPCKHVHRHMLTTSVNKPGNKSTASEGISVVSGSRFLIACFNKYMDRKTVKIVRYASNSPVAMWGVPKDTETWI